MTNIFSRLNKRTYTLFVIIGFLLSYAVFELLTNWIQIFAFIYDKPDLGYHELPSYIHVIQGAVRWLIWVILGIIFALDFPKREFTRTFGYSTGIVVAGVVIFIVIMYRFGEAMEGF